MLWLGRLANPDQRGQSAVDVLIGLGLSIILFAMIAQLMRVARYEVDLRTRSLQQRDLRLAMDRAMGELRNSRPLGQCASQPGAAMSACQRVEERPFTLATEKPSTSQQVCFYAQRDASTDPFLVPDLVCVKVSGTQLVVETTEGTGTYTNPSWPGASRSRRIGTVDPAATTFVYYAQQADGSAAEVAPSVTVSPGVLRLSDADLRRVLFIEARVGVAGPSLVNKAVSSQITFQAALRGSRLQREQNFQEL